MNHAIIENLPKDPAKIREIYEDALKASYLNWVDEKGTTDNPGVWQRKKSKLSYEEAFKIISENHPHWVISFRNTSYLNKNEIDYWEFGGCNIASNDYGEVFIWIQLTMEEAEIIFEKYNLQPKFY